MNKFKRLFIVSILISFPTLSFATLFDDIGYSELQASLGVSTPDGSGVSVAIAEAFTGSGCDLETTPGSCVYRPDKAIKNYRDDDTTPAPPLGYDHSLVPINLALDPMSVSSGFSSHASGVARRFYGDPQSTAPGISEVHVFAADHWLGSGYLNTGEMGDLNPATSNIRVSNHSYQGGASSSEAITEAIEILSRIDWIVDQDEQNVVTASTSTPINGTAFNAIAVGRTDASGPPMTSAMIVIQIIGVIPPPSTFASTKQKAR